MSDEKTYYVGKSGVESIQVTENIDLVGVLYKNGKTEDFTVEQWEAVKSELPYEDGEVSNRKHEGLMVRILKQMVKSRVTIGEQDWILQRINQSIGENYRKSIAKVYGVSFPEKIMLAQIDEVLKAELPVATEEEETK